MTHTRKYGPISPRQAGRRPSVLDRRLDHELFKALSDPTRVRLVACLAKCGRTGSVSEVAECCTVDYSVVSRHLAQLAKAGVLESHKDGRTVRYGVRYGSLSRLLRELADAIDECCPDGAASCGPCRCA